MDKRSTFSHLLQTIRKQKGLTQLELAFRSGISRRMINYYETHVSHPSIEKIKLLAHALGVTPSDLLSTEKNEPESNDVLSEFSHTNMKTLKNLQKILRLNQINRSAVYRYVELLLNEQEKINIPQK